MDPIGDEHEALSETEMLEAIYGEDFTEFVREKYSLQFSIRVPSEAPTLIPVVCSAGHMMQWTDKDSKRVFARESWHCRQCDCRSTGHRYLCIACSAGHSTVDYCCRCGPARNSNAGYSSHICLAFKLSSSYPETASAQVLASINLVPYNNQQIQDVHKQTKRVQGILIHK
jgi:hypothetical protein